MPISGDCVVTSGATMLGGRNSGGSLVIRANTGELMVGNDDPSFDQSLGRGTYTFAGGTLIEIGGLYVRQFNTLASHVTIQRADSSNILVAGTVNGNVSNAGALRLSRSGVINGNVLNERAAIFWGGRINGNLHNTGNLHVSGTIYEKGINPRIAGDFTQTATGETMFDLPPAGLAADFSGTLFVEGRAQLAGTLALNRYDDGWGPYPLPAAGSHWLIHADGGVFGQFDRWIAPGLFIEGALRYGSNDVWFDLRRISLAAAMTSNSIGSALTIASAVNLDRALAGADAFASVSPASLSTAQSRFLQSAGRVLWLSDPTQAQRSLDSLAGSVHADALQRAGQADAMSWALAQRLLTLQPGQVAGTWSRLGGQGTVAGFDQWLGPRLLLGASTSQGSTEFGGQARDHASEAALYLRWFGDNGWYAGGSAGFARHALTVNRPIDLGPGGRWNAHSQRAVGIAAIDAEVGHRFNVGGGILAPYAALGADVIRSERALEQGTTGFELALQANTQARLNAGVGLHYGRRWQLGDGGWMQLDADARMQHGLANAGAPLQAAFIGVPDVGFALPGSLGNTAGWMSLGLRGGTATGWEWSLGHAGSFAGPRPDRQWSLGLQRGF